MTNRIIYFLGVLGSLGITCLFISLYYLGTFEAFRIAPISVASALPLMVSCWIVENLNTKRGVDI